MKKFGLLVLVLLVVFSVQSYSQETVVAAGPWSIGVGGMGGVPVGDFGTGFSIGLGGGGWVAYQVDPSLSLTGRAGYMSFSNDFSGGPSLRIIPILAGARYYMTPSMESTSMRSYVAGELGMYSASVSGGSSDSNFGFAPTLGAQFRAGDKMNVDVYANYTIVMTDPSSTNWVGFGIGLEFGM